MDQRQTWQYRSVWVDQMWTVMTDISTNGNQSLEPVGFVEYLNILGAEGWELVTVLRSEKGARAFLKRADNQ